MRKFLFVFIIFCTIIIARKIMPEIDNVTEATSACNKLPQEGLTSWYGEDFQGKEMANGKIFNQYHLTAAHRYYPLGIKLKVINIENKKSVIVTVTDRGPFISPRVLDLSYAAAKEINIIKVGV
ncbi:MAG: septal ring lytic transglycosylase RlpA family protein, partial [Patescibacteria group bacterium]